MLIQRARDHALLLSAINTGKASLDWTAGEVTIDGITLGFNWDEFNCPELTTELREALEALVLK